MSPVARPGGLRRPVRALVHLPFLLPGACGLIYQVAWSRIPTQILGSTVLAVGTVLAAFMAGLAAGSAWLGRTGDRSRNPLALHALYEHGMGAVAAGFLFLGKLGVHAILRIDPQDGFALALREALSGTRREPAVARG